MTRVVLAALLAALFLLGGWLGLSYHRARATVEVAASMVAERPCEALEQVSEMDGLALRLVSVDPVVDAAAARFAERLAPDLLRDLDSETRLLGRANREASSRVPGKLRNEVRRCLTLGRRSEPAVEASFVETAEQALARAVEAQATREEADGPGFRLLLAALQAELPIDAAVSSRVARSSVVAKVGAGLETPERRRRPRPGRPPLLTGSYPWLFTGLRLARQLGVELPQDLPELLRPILVEAEQTLKTHGCARQLESIERMRDELPAELWGGPPTWDDLLDRCHRSAVVVRGEDDEARVGLLLKRALEREGVLVLDPSDDEDAARLRRGARYHELEIASKLGHRGRKTYRVYGEGRFSLKLPTVSVTVTLGSPEGETLAELRTTRRHAPFSLSFSTYGASLRSQKASAQSKVDAEARRRAVQDVVRKGRAQNAWAGLRFE